MDIWGLDRTAFTGHLLYARVAGSYIQDIFFKLCSGSKSHILLFIVVVQSLSCIWLFVTPWTAARQASVFFTVSWSLIKLMAIESMMPSNHLILCAPLHLLPSSFPASGSFPMSWLFTSGGQGIRAAASASVLSMNVQCWFPLGLTGLISLLSKRL